jgi:hypothetical protein
MTFAELLEETMENISLHPKYDQVQRGEAKRLLNLAQREISLRLGLPRQEVTVPQSGVATGPFRLPARFHPEAGLRVSLIDGVSSAGLELRRGMEIRVLSPGEEWDFYSHQPFGHWGGSERHRLPAMKYDRADTELVFTPLGIEEGQFRFIINPVPPDMVEDTDEPFSMLDWCEEPPIRTRGAFPAYHRVLAHHASYELLQRLEAGGSMQPGTERWRQFYARYREMEKEMFARVSPTTVYLPGWTVEASGG